MITREYDPKIFIFGLKIPEIRSFNSKLVKIQFPYKKPSKSTFSIQIYPEFPFSDVVISNQTSHKLY